MFGRRWSNGCTRRRGKECCQVEEENQTLPPSPARTTSGSIRSWGYDRTAKTEEDEFRKIYALDVVEIPTNRAVLRKDASDIIYKSGSQVPGYHNRGAKRPHA